MGKMTCEQRLERLAYENDWSEDMVSRLKNGVADNKFSDEEFLSYATNISLDACLSVLRDGDASLDKKVANAFGCNSTDEFYEYKAIQLNLIVEQEILQQNMINHY